MTSQTLQKYKRIVHPISTIKSVSEVVCPPVKNPVIVVVEMLSSDVRSLECNVSLSVLLTIFDA